MSDQRWLAIYINEHGQIGAAMLSPHAALDFPFGVDLAAIGMEGANSGIAVIEMPTDPAFRPMIVDCDQEEEVALQFIDIGF